jgi:hypothetical protein
VIFIPVFSPSTKEEHNEWLIERKINNKKYPKEQLDDAADGVRQ